MLVGIQERNSRECVGKKTCIDCFGVHQQSCHQTWIVVVNKCMRDWKLHFLSNISGNKSPKKKGKSKRAHVLVAAVERATANFVERGNQVIILLIRSSFLNT
jgi:hypothetical protein